MVCTSGVNTVFVNGTAVGFINSPSFSSQMTGPGSGSFESDSYFVLASMQNVEFRNVTGTTIFKGILTEVSYKFGPDRIASYKLQDYSFFLKRKIIYGDFEGTVDDVLMNVINMSGTGPLWNPLVELGIAGTYKKQFTGQHLGEALQSICQDNNLRYFIEPTGELRIRRISSEPELSPKRTITLPYNEVCGLSGDVIENIGYQKKFPELSKVLVYGGSANDKFIQNFVPLDKNRVFDIPIESVQQHFELFEDCIALRDVVMTITGEGTTPDFYMEITPYTRTINVSGCKSYTITVIPVGGFTGIVALSLETALPAGTTYTITPGSVELDGISPATATLEICDTAIECYPPPSECANGILNVSGGGFPSCPFCQTMYVTFKAYIEGVENTNCVGEVVTVMITPPPGADNWWTASDSSISLTIAASLAEATGVTVEFYPNGCDADGCNINNRSWVGPNGICGGQSTSGGCSVTWPNGNTVTRRYTVSEQGGC
jgi:hypothetical protein